MLAALLCLLALCSAPFGAGQAAAQTLPVPGLAVRDASTLVTVERGYEYPSVSFLRDEIRFDSKVLSTTYLARIKPADSYKGKVGSENHVLSYWKEYAERSKQGTWEALTPEKQRQSWDGFLDRFIRIIDNNARGRAFEREYDRVFGLKDSGYLLDARFPGISDNRRADAFREERGGVILEFKSGSSAIDRDQARFLGEQAVRLNKSLYYIFAKSPQQRDLNFLVKLNTELARSHPPTDHGISSWIDTRAWPVRAIPTRHPNAPPAGPIAGKHPTLGDGSLVARGQHVNESAALDAVAASPGSAREAAGLDAMERDLALNESFERATSTGPSNAQLGGVDFSTLQLTYVADTYDGSVGTGVRYAYTVERAPGKPISFGGRAAAQLASDAFFTWLALNPSLFTVNLNPDEPDRIIDAGLGSTDAGRVLLEADLQMKKSVAALIHPGRKRGKRFWSALRGTSKCISMRQWIVPGKAVVRQTANELFIIDAPLAVKMETEYIKSRGVAGEAGCKGQASRDTKSNEKIYRKTILPEVQKKVNSAPEYADLRRVYVSRVAAEWYRQRSQDKPTAYRALIDSGDVSDWPTRVQWSPTDTFDRYVKSYRDGEFSVTRVSRRGHLLRTNVYVYGGVDLRSVGRTLLNAQQTELSRPSLRASADRAVVEPAVEKEVNQIWLGGRTGERQPWQARPVPNSALGHPWFYVVTGLPVAGWLLLGGIWLRRRTSAAMQRNSVRTTVAAG